MEPGSNRSLTVLTSHSIPQSLKDSVHESSGGAVAFLRSESTVAEWSTNWLGYTCYDVVLVTETEAAAMPADVLQALRRYVETGGVVLVYVVEVRGKATDFRRAMPEALRDPGAGTDESLFHVGFGTTRVFANFWPTDSSLTVSKEPTVPGDKNVKVAGEFNVPVRGLLILVILFAVGIGPVNLWLLSRRQKRMWLWWNVPAVSVLTCLAVFAYSLFSEGFTGRGRTVVLTLLDENAHHATTIGYASFYCPLAPSDGLRFSYDTEVTPLHASTGYDFDPYSYRRSYRRQEGRAMTIDWTNDQHLESGWVASRVPAYFAVRKSETRRERLAVHKSGPTARSTTRSSTSRGRH